MPDPTGPLIFDGHNDALLKLASNGGLANAGQFLTGYGGAVDVPKARQGGFGGGFFAVFVPSPADLDRSFAEMTRARYDLPLPPGIPQAEAVPVVAHQMAILFALETQGALRLCRSVADIRRALAEGRMAAVLHMEGAEALDPELHMLDLFYRAGLRSLGPVWSRPNGFGHGVPFRFPADPDIGPGLSDAGKRLIRRCNALRIMVDLSHLNAAGFRDVAAISDAPLVATHSGAHALCPHARNLTDDQLDAIRDSDGMVGVNLAVAFLRADGRMLPDVQVTQVLAHIDYLIARVGEGRVGLGSDYDGAVVPRGLDTVADLPLLRRAMADHGYDLPLIERLCHGNWLRVLERTWGE